ncbi:MAG TPA: cytochrome c [Bacteroidia bacterium]|jgi:mono/diheme cytochrome c family protein|nr:cytochrome c [Bacteroidia bacterium]
MNSKIIYGSAILTALLISGCNNNQQQGKETTPSVVTKTDTVVVSPGINSKGIGRFKDVPLTHPLDMGMVEKGKTLYDAKCSACHKLTAEKLVGPGWKGVNDRHTPEWIMNFITNTEVMLDKDLAAQAEVVTCLVRMPNQDLTDEQARQILEFTRQNDGKQ